MPYTYLIQPGSAGGRPVPQPAFAARGPIARAERSLAPDLARGSMLLFIALANAPGIASGGPSHAPHPQGLERVANFLIFACISARAYPVFALMFGYGLVQLARRQQAGGATPGDVRTVLVRRSLALILFGLAHAALLYFADFLGAYGVIGVLATFIFLGRPRVQRVVLWLWAFSLLEVAALAAWTVVRLANATGPTAMLPAGVQPSFVATDYVSAVSARLSEWPMHTLTVIPVMFIVCVGMWAAERRVLEQLAQHRRALRWCAALGLLIAFAGGLPLGLVAAGALHTDADAVSMMSLLHKVSGMFAGPGYVALIGLAALRSQRGASKRQRLVRWVAALGQRSLSGYLFQSCAWLLLFAPYTLALGGRFGSPLGTALGAAALVWVLSVLGAAFMERHAARGLMERILRWLTYGPKARGGAG